MGSVNLEGLVTSRLGFGTSRLHHMASSRARQMLLAQAHERGIVHFDTAPLYGHGLAERELGAFCKAHPQSRLVIVTKYGLPPSALVSRVPKGLLRPALVGRAVALKLAGRLRIGQGAGQGSGQASGALPPLTPTGLQASVEASLRRLQRDHIEVHMLHQADLARISDPDALLRTYEDLVAAGKVGRFGVSGDAAPAMAVLDTWQRGLFQTGEREWDPARPPHMVYSALADGPQRHGVASGLGADEAAARLVRAMERRAQGVVLVSTRSTHNLAALCDAAQTVAG